jgi:N-acetylglutamate synthase-like GNAT family acetyltransferase
MESAGGKGAGQPAVASGRLRIRRLERADAEACDAIVWSLPDYFGHEGGLASCAEAVRSQPGWVAEEAGHLVGFATWERRTPEAAEITWMAVHRERRHAGIGTAIIERLVGELREKGFSVALAMTSAEGKDGHGPGGHSRGDAALLDGPRLPTTH